MFTQLPAAIKVLLSFFVGLIILGAAGALCYSGLNALIRSAEEAEAANQTLDHLDNVISILQSAETGQRGYFLTGDEKYREPYDRAVQKLGTELAGLTHMVSLDKEQKARVEELSRLAELKMSELLQTIKLHDAGRTDEAMQIVRSGEGKRLMEQIRAVGSQLDEAQRASCEQRAEETRNLAWRARETIPVATVLALGMSALAWITICRYLRQRTEAEAALARSEAMLRSFYDSDLVMMGVVEPLVDDILLISQNVASARTRGVTPEAMTGRRASEFGVSREEIRFWLDRYEEAGCRGGPVQFEICSQRKDGLHWIAATVSPILSSSSPGSASGARRFAYVAEDVTDKHLAQEALRRSEERLKLALESTRDGLWDLDLTTNLCFFSSRWLSMFGYDAIEGSDDNGGLNAPISIWENRINPEEVVSFRERLNAHIEGRSELFEQEQRICTEDGSLRWVLCRGRIVARDESGKPRRMVGTVINDTERRSADERFRVLFDCSTDAHLLFDETGIIDCNRAAVEMLRCQDKSEVLGLHPSVLSPEYQPDGRHSIEKGVEMDALAHANGHHRFDWVHRRLDGDEFPCEVTLNPVTVQGKAALLVVWHDLTERKIAEEAIRASEKRYRSLVESIPQLVWSCDPSGRSPDFNQLWCEYTGLSREKLIGNGWIHAVHPDDRAHALASWQQIVNTGDLYQVEYRLRRAGDGAYRWHLTRGRPMRDETGRIIRWFGTCTDVHDQKVAEDELRLAKNNAEAINRELAREIDERRRAEAVSLESEHRFDAFINNSSALAYMKDESGRYQFVNEPLLRQFHVRAENWLGKTDAELWPPAVAAELRRNDLAVFASGKLTQLFESMIGPDGSEQCFLSFKFLFTNQSGRRLLGGVSIDVTGQKRIEEELRYAKEAAEAANRAKSEFLANVSHEIRTPMNGILGMTELALAEESVQHQRDRLRIVHDSATSLLNIINDLLDFSKIEAGKLELDPVRFDLHRELGNTVRLLAEHAHRKGLELVCRIAPDVPVEVVGDSDRLRQVLINLLGNSIKFTERGGIQVGVELVSRNVDEVRLVFSVRDTGVGIPEDKLERIFLPFEQADTSTTRRFGGTGLGLTIASRLVGLMGGQVEVESKPGVGTTFWFTVRFATVADKSGSISTSKLEAMDVLVVEHSVFNRSVLVEMLTSWRMRPTLLACPAEVLEAVELAQRENRPFALAMVDEDLPGGDGLKLTRQLRTKCGFTGPVLLLRRAGMRHEGNSADADVTVCLEKPFTPSELLAALAKALRLSHIGTVRQPPVMPQLSTFRKLRVLLAEDNPINQKVATGVLQRLGHEVEVVGTGREALAILEQMTFDVVLMDVQMPDMDGLETTVAIRRREIGIGRRLPIVAMTARAMKGDEEECLRAGMDAYLSKPFQPIELDRILARLAPSNPGPTAPSSLLASVPSPANVSPPIDDPAALLEAVDGSGELLQELVQLFSDDSPLLLDEIRSALAAGNAEKTERAAHKLAGSISNFHAHRALKAVRLLENLARNGKLNEAPAALAELEDALTLLHPALIALVEQMLKEKTEDKCEAAVSPKDVAPDFGGRSENGRGISCPEHSIDC